MALAPRPAAPRLAAGPRFAGLAARLRAVVPDASPAWCVPMAAAGVQALPALPPVWLVQALALASLVCLPWARRARVARLLVLFLLGLAAALAAAQAALDDRLPARLEGLDLRVRGHVAGDVRQHGQGTTFAFEITTCTESARALPCGFAGTVRLGWYGSDPLRAGLWPGDRLQLNVRLRRPAGVVNPGGFDAEAWALQRGVAARGYVRAGKADSEHAHGNALLAGASLTPGVALEQWRTATERHLEHALREARPDAAGIVLALVTGRQSAIAPSLWDLFNRTATSHLMSISGLHVTMFAAMTLFLMRRLLRLPLPGTPPLLERIGAPALSWLVALPAAFAYAAFSGWGVPAQRTCWMLLIAGVAALAGRTRRLEPVLALAAALVTLLDPWAVLAPGFWLSFGTVAAIAMAASPVRPGVRRRWVEPVRAQWAASVLLVPLGAAFFGAIAMLGPLANALAIPLVSALITPVAMAGAALAVPLPELAQWPLGLAWRSAAALVVALRWIDGLPGNQLVTGSGDLLALALALSGTLVVLMPSRPLSRISGGLAMAPLLLGLGAPILRPGEWSVHAIDVGQGNALLIETARHRLLYDTGPSHGPEGSGAGDRIIAPWLRARGIGRLDRLVVSHDDRDHWGGAAEIARQFDIGLLMGSLAATHVLRALPVTFEDCGRGRRWHWDGVHFEIIHPGPPEAGPPASDNSRSCVLRIRSAAGSALLTGDIERADEARLVQIYGSAGLRSDLLLVPHHGSRTSSSEAFIDAVSPTMAVVQAGWRNRYRHPAAPVLDRYRDRGVRVLRTDLDGALSIRFATGQPASVVRARRDHPPYWRVDVSR